MTIVLSSGNKILSVRIVSSFLRLKLTTPPALFFSMFFFISCPFNVPNNLLPVDFLGIGIQVFEVEVEVEVGVPSDPIANLIFLIFGILRRPDVSVPSSFLFFISLSPCTLTAPILLLLLLLLLLLMLLL